MKNEIILYRPNEMAEHIEVRLENDTVWLNRNQIALLFGRDVKTIGKHINNALKEELDGIPTVANFAIVHFEGNRKVTRSIEHYNLDVILSVGYRVKSKQGTLFRIWANRILKNHLLQGYTLNERINFLGTKSVKRHWKINQSNRSNRTFHFYQRSSHTRCFLRWTNLRCLRIDVKNYSFRQKGNHLNRQLYR
jgi:hypothetical protein